MAEYPPTLAGIRSFAEAFEKVPEAFDQAVLVRKMLALLAAADAVVDLHKPTPSVRLEPCERHRHWRGPLVGDPDSGQRFETENLAERRACPECRVFDFSHCRRCVDDEGSWQVWPCPTYAAIRAALFGEETSGG